MAVSSETNTNETPQPVSAIGFEGFEKRLEISFSNPPILSDPNGLGLRGLTRAQIDSILYPAACTIVSQLRNSELDSYVLSESSLFVYPLKIILKTCGTTKLLFSIEPILKLANSAGLTVSRVLYSRGTFNFPNAQLSPHRSFAEEVSYLNGYFGNLPSGPHAYVLGDPAGSDRKWHIYSASVAAEPGDPTAEITVEMCMTGLDRSKAAVFYKAEGNDSKKMTKDSGISDVIPSHVICDFDFDPCGYSMNGIDGGAYSTVHVTPEDGFSYASYEAMGLDPGSDRFGPLVKRVLRCFLPKELTVSVTCYGEGARDWVSEKGADVEGFTCKSGVKQVLPGGGVIVYKTYVAEQPASEVNAPPHVFSLPWWKDVAAAEVAEDGGEMVGGCGVAAGNGLFGCAFVSPV